MAVVPSASAAVAENPGNDRATYMNTTRGRKCYHCGSESHIKRNCEIFKNQVYAGQQPKTANISAVKLAPVGNHAFVKATACKNRKKTDILFLIDSGANCNVLDKKFAHLCRSHIRPCNVQVQSATGKTIGILGQADLYFEIGGIKLKERFLISSDVQESILSINFLQNNGCVWNFATNHLELQGQSIALQRVAEAARVRKLIATDSVLVPAKHEALLPVKALVTRTADFHANWLTDVTCINDRVITARTILSDRILNGIKVCNPTDRDCVISRNTVVTVATHDSNTRSNVPVDIHDGRTEYRNNVLYAYYTDNMKCCDQLARNNYLNCQTECSDKKSLQSDSDKSDCDLSVSEIKTLTDPAYSMQNNNYELRRDVKVGNPISDSQNRDLADFDIEQRREDIIQQLMDTIDPSVSAQTRDETRQILQEFV